MRDLIILGVIFLANGLVHVISGGPRDGARVLSWQRGRGLTRRSYERTTQAARRHRLSALAMALAGLALVIVGAVAG